MALFDFGNGPVRAHRHPNGGGWVANTAGVEDSVYIDSEAVVYENAVVLGEARIFGSSRIKGSAVVGGKVRVNGASEVYGSALILGEAQLAGFSRVFGYARVHGEAVVYGRVGGNAIVGGYSVIGITEEVLKGIRNTTAGDPIGRSALERVVGEDFLRSDPHQLAGPLPSRTNCADDESRVEDICTRFECTSDIVREHELFDELADYARGLEARIRRAVK